MVLADGGGLHKTGEDNNTLTSLIYIAKQLHSFPIMCQTASIVQIILYFHLCCLPWRCYVYARLLFLKLFNLFGFLMLVALSVVSFWVTPLTIIQRKVVVFS